MQGEGVVAVRKYETPGPWSEISVCESERVVTNRSKMQAKFIKLASFKTLGSQNMSQFEEIQSPGIGFQGSRAWVG